AKEEGVKVQADKQPQHNRFIRSDQYSFVKHGIPALAFKFGYIPETPEEKTFQGWLHTRYHAPSDDISQPVDLAAAAKFDRVIERLLTDVANDQEKPQWLPTSFFRRFAR
ncbi:MAG: M28 family peptidase, partial [Bryobacteraceae bacterium]